MKRKPPIVGRVPRDTDADRELFLRSIAKLDPQTTRNASKHKRDRASPSVHGPRLARNLERGNLEPGTRIDLHGLTRTQANERLEAFISQCPWGEIALIIHGKGSGILATVVIHFLDQSNRVAEHLSAPPRLGGEGARVVRLRSRSS